MSFTCHFGVCGRIELIALAKKLILQFLIILNDTIVNANHISIIGGMWMGICLRRLSMSRPAGMTEADAALEVRAAVDLFAEDLEPAHRFFDLQLSLRRDDGHARGVIPAVFQNARARPAGWGPPVPDQ